MRDNGEVIRTWLNMGVILITDDSKLTKKDEKKHE